MRTKSTAPLVALLAALATGCRSTGIAQRKAERPGAYNSLSAKLRSVVDRGKIDLGMDTNAVFIAWGPPTGSVTLDSAGGQRQVWNYEKNWSYKRTRWAERGSSYGRPTYVIESQRIQTTYVARSVVFVNGKVAQWKKHKPPILEQPIEKPRYSPHAF